MARKLLLLQNQTVDGVGPEFITSGSARTLFCTGNFGGGTASVEVSIDDGVIWVPVPDAAFVANDVVNFQMSSSCKVRGILSGSTGATINMTLI